METNETTSPVSTRSTGLKFGLIAALVSIAFFLILTVMGQNAFDQSISWIGMIFTIVLLVLAHKNFKDQGDGYMSYGQGIMIGIWMTLVSLLIGGAVTWLYLTVIDPVALEAVWQAEADKMAARGMSHEQIDMGLSIGRKLFWPMYFVMGFIGSLIIALLVTIFTQKKNPQPEF